jgi:hypothetical protein
MEAGALRLRLTDLFSACRQKTSIADTTAPSWLPGGASTMTI